MKKIIFFIITLIVINCTSTQQVMDSWIGSQKADIIRSWGPPQGGIVSDGNGGEILLYNNERTVFTPVYNTVVQKNINNYKQVYCDADGKIYLIRWGQQ